MSITINNATNTVTISRQGTQGPPGGGAVDSVNGQTGTVVLSAADVGADSAGTATAAVTAHEAAADPHPQYTTAAEAAAAAPVQTVAGRTGNVTLATADVTGAVDTSDARLSDARTPTAHPHPSTDISDSTATGRAVLTAADAETAQTAIGIRDNTNYRLGFKSLNSLTTGVGNYGIGYRSLYKNETGSYNYASGESSTYNLINGSYNYAVGYYTLYNLVGSSGNTAINTQALYNLGTGNFNNAIGYYAGMLYGSGSDPLTSADYGIFIGYDCRASANGNTNEIVIGSNAIGSGSNTATIGSSATTLLYTPGQLRALGSYSATVSDSANVNIDSSGNIKRSTATMLRRVAVPSNASASGTVGDVAYDANYAYFCTATNTWVRCALATW